MTNSDLIMELTMEQGPGRESQVQPPVGVWGYYFDVDVYGDTLPELTLRNADNGQTETRPVVEHDHNWTVEVSGATVERPAIIRFRRTADDRYDYWVYVPDSPEYDHCRWILDTFPNPLRQRGRRWLVV